MFSVTSDSMDPEILQKQLTRGICLGSVTSLVKSLAPSSGHDSSTSFICSQRSAWVLMRVMRPYLTERLIYASCSIFWVKLPLALICRALPLQDD